MFYTNVPNCKSIHQTMKEEEIPVLLSQSTVEVKFPVIPEAVYFLKVLLRFKFSLNIYYFCSYDKNSFN